MSASSSAVVRRARGGYSDYPAIDIDDEGNVVLAYALPSAGLWKTGFSRHGRAAGQWTHAPTVNDGAAGNQIIVGPSGRIHQVYTGGALTSPKYRYSDDGGQTWSELGNIVGSMKVGGICSLALDSQERPHLWCGFNSTGPDAEKPTYIRWDGSTWVRQVIDLVGASYDDARLFLGFQDRPHVFHTYGPTEGTNRDLHYAYYTGTQWLQEAVPFPEHLIVHPDRHPGAVLAPGDTLHIAFPVRDPAEGTYAVWYGMRTALGAWTFEEAIPPESLSGGQWSDTHLVLDEEGRLVILTALGSLAWRDSSGVWRHRAIEHENGVLAVWRGVAYVVFPTNEGTRALHLDLFPLEP